MEPTVTPRVSSIHINRTGLFKFVQGSSASASNFTRNPRIRLRPGCRDSWVLNVNTHLDRSSILY